MNRRRVLILGLDGMAPDLIQQWIAAGELPAFAALRRAGSFGLLRSSVNSVTPSAWTSMATGVGPGQHGLFNFVEYVPATHTLLLPDSRRRRMPTIWELAGDAGRRCCILRVPMTFPATPVNGWLVAGILAPSIRHEGFAWPAELAGELRRQFGPYGWGQKWGDDAPVITGKYGRALRQLLAGVDRGFDLIEFGLEQESWDLVFAVLHEPDEAGHNFWHLMDTESPYHDPAAAVRHGDGMRRVYQRIDARLGALMRRVGRDTAVLVVSDHGLGGRRPAAWHVRALLVAAGFQVLREAPPADGGIRGRLLGVKQAVTRRIPWGVRRRFRPLSRELRRRGATESLLGTVDWHSTAAFTLVGGCTGEIWLHLAGRCPGGTLQPGQQQETALKALREMLNSAAEARSGRRVVKKVEAGAEACPGPFGESIPDLVVTFDESIHCDAVTATHPFTGERITVDGASPGHWDLPHRGFHRRDGLLLAAGRGIAASEEMVRASVTDIAPLALYLLGLPIPENMEGKLLEPLIQPDLLRNEPPMVGPPLSARALDDADLSDADRARIEQRLRELGYL